MISENFREKLDKGSPSYTFYSIEIIGRILTTEEANIFENAFDKRQQRVSSGSFSRTFTLEDHMPKNFEYAAINQTLLRRRDVVYSSAPFPLTDEEALLIAAASDQQAQEFFEKTRSERLERLIKNYATYLTDEDKAVLARQKSPTYSPEPAPQKERPILAAPNNREDPRYARQFF